MERNFRVFVDKAAKIIADAPYYANKHDKIRMLNQKFRLGKKESRLLLRAISKKGS